MFAIEYIAASARIRCADQLFCLNLVTTQVFFVWRAILEKNQRHPREGVDPERFEGPANVPSGFPPARISANLKIIPFVNLEFSFSRRLGQTIAHAPPLGKGLHK
ncbi:hypothetical protein [Polaromonas glacialis]|uniref:hypothetical protein n=1 Tax=Polaromonas glacialis TaxID=866564 RepID=UPI0012EC1D32|nr:hypothetical protein [Polaromonas glacialis]